MMNRRGFLQTAARGAAGCLFLPQVGLGGRLSQGRKINKIGLQLYTVRDAMAKDFDGTLARVAAIGIKEVEFAGYYNRAPKQVKAALAANGLTSPAAHAIVKVIREQWPQTIEAAAEIGHKYLVCSYLFPEERKSLDDYKRYVDLFNRAGEACKKVGIQFGYHNHDFEFVPLDGQVPYDLLLAQTDPDLVKLELDLYWISKAGRQPKEYFDKYPGRFPLFHVKDMDNTPQKGFTEVGRGVVDFKTIFAQATKSGVKHYLIEQDQTPGSPFDSIKISYDYLRRLRY